MSSMMQPPKRMESLDQIALIRQELADVRQQVAMLQDAILALHEKLDVLANHSPVHVTINNGSNDRPSIAKEFNYNNPIQ
jgi:hypothetical protein